jgi:hypothetical protein
MFHPRNGLGRPYPLPAKVPLAFALLLLGPFFQGTWAQSSELDGAAYEAATAISQSTKYMKGAARVLVYDFSNPHRPERELGIKLADEFDAALRRQAHGFTILDRDTTLEKKASRTDVIDTQDDSECRQRSREPDVTVEGSFDNLPGGMVALRIKVAFDRQQIFDETLKLTIPPKLVASLPARESLPGYVRGKIAWTRPGYASASAAKPVHRSDENDDAKEYKELVCLYCPQAQLPHEARAPAGAVSEIVILDVEVDEEGLPASIGVIKAIPCALTDKAVEAVAVTVKHWRLSPAVGPDGKPVRVITSLEITFRDY